ncbi:class I SAM-dependent DNA methyltransferase [Plantactinospora sp. KLBMP9567]|uniref:class I SAM-dependent DNA methyltransferase n=1 Tax=Plantactinospora sp. KLBMP9567 TaxID=3085900 RepID=UPI0029814E39|nr:class I SAM-dependent DNA methyltransferase [Plantactinospora sp. KLBMP9567]MDW5329053.1 class I SAM-dependent DNA methyltransferase [Plantactinospora sp. KLBMP9567]
MSFESLTNRGEYLSAHYLAEVLPTTLKGGLVKRWSEEERGGRVTPRAGLRGFRRDYFDRKIELADPELFDPERLRKLHFELLKVLGFGDPQRQTITVERAGQEQEIPVAHAELLAGAGHGIVALDCGWAVDTDAAQDPTEAGRLLDPVELAGGERVETGAKLASWLFAAEDPPRYVLIMSGGVITLADRSVWGEGRYLAVSLDVTYGRNDERELDVVAALFGADSLRPPAEGGSEPLADLVAGSRQHAVGVSGELREGLRTSVELIANEVLDRIRQAGYRPEQVADLDELARDLGREALRYLYRILFLLYAEARPELGVLPVNDPEYVSGYSLARLGDLISRRLPPSAEEGFHLYESLDLLCRMVNEGHRPRGAGEEVSEQTSEDVGLRFEPMRSDLFLPEAIRLIGRQIPQPGSDEDDPDDPYGPKLDTRLRNRTLYQVLRRLMITKGGRRKRGGFISYAQLGINQLGAVYEGLMSYTGFVATERLYEVAKHGDPKDGSWMIPESKVDDYDDEVFVLKENPVTGAKSRIPYEPGSFVYRLAGRDRQTSASYYTPQSLTEVTVQLALKYRIEEAGDGLRARDLLDWTICEPALGSGAFLNEAINQVAAEYLRRRQEELETALEPEDYHLELQRVKAYIALHNCYGVDLNRTAVELAEVSLWLNVMHVGLQAPWFGLHLKRGNSLIGGGRRLYRPEQLADKSWLHTAPEDRPFRDGAIEPGTIHHFLLPADGWGAVAGEKEARELAPAETEKLKKWRTAMRRTPSTKGKKSQVKRLQGLARRVEFLWNLVQQRLAISERDIRRDIKVWGADDLPEVTEAVAREKILTDLTAPGTPYWRLKTLMDVWCSLWCWPLEKVGLLDSSDSAAYPATPVEVTHVRDEPAYDEPAVYEVADFFGQVQAQQLKIPTKLTVGTRRTTVAEQLRQQVPLANLDDWLAFTEALVGRRDLDEDSERLWGRSFTTLSEMNEFEGKLDGLIGVDSPWTLSDRFPWLLTAERVADQQGFFHWELTFAQAFAKGGFDLQVGNPPWVRLDWREDVVLAERNPWFRMTTNASTATWNARKLSLFEDVASRAYLLNELTGNAGIVGMLGHPSKYPLLAGTRPDLYRAFMCQTWRHISMSGTVGLVHPDTHFSGAKEGPLRAAAYRALRMHAHFQNMRLIFAEIDWKIQFGIHVYGKPRNRATFTHVSWLFAPETLRESLVHNGKGELPGIKQDGSWDLRPHAARLVQVDDQVLSEWQMLVADADVPPGQTRLLYPVTVAEQGAISALAASGRRLADLRPFISSGYNEKNARSDGLIKWDGFEPDDWSEVILQGPHLGVATPLFKNPRIPSRSNKDYDSWSLVGCPTNAVPRSNYRRSVDRATYEKAQDTWDGRRYTEYYRLAWREMIPLGNERSLFAALVPPGPTHIHAVRSMALRTNRETALQSGFWASLPFDYALRISGRGHLDVNDACLMPAPSVDHALAGALLLRALRLNCLTSAYSSLWTELFDPGWVDREGWAVNWRDLSGVAPLSEVSPKWNYRTPLRTERSRRAALVEIDALVSAWLGVDAEELISIYRSRFAVLAGYESAMWFDGAGRKITRDYYAQGVGQPNDAYAKLIRHLDDPERNPVPEGYEPPFYKADRENEYRQAHAEFCRRLAEHALTA